MRTIAERGKFPLSDMDMAIFTQVRLHTILKVMDVLGLPHSKTHWIMDKWGYTGLGLRAHVLRRRREERQGAFRRPVHVCRLGRRLQPGGRRIHHAMRRSA